MAFTFTPTVLDLGSVWTETSFSQTFSVTYTSDLSDPTDVLNTVVITGTAMNYLTQSGQTASGVFPLSIFDQYYITYVEKGYSDLNQQPITVQDLDNVPYFKEVYDIKMDPRDSIDVDFLVLATSTGGSSESQTYTLRVYHNYTKLNTWIDDYFKNRY